MMEARKAHEEIKWRDDRIIPYKYIYEGYGGTKDTFI